jgi:hypothetical protein
MGREGGREGERRGEEGRRQRYGREGKGMYASIHQGDQRRWLKLRFVNFYIKRISIINQSINQNTLNSEHNTLRHNM